MANVTDTIVEETVQNTLPEEQNPEKRKQKYLGKKGLIVLIALLSAFVPLSTDLYMPALPSMTVYFSTSESLVNLTLYIFFVFFSIGTLFWGPLSDKYGRRPVLIIGISVFTACSILCALSSSIYFLIAARVMQAAGGSAASAVSTAIVKDSFSGKSRLAVLAVVQVLFVVAPAAAPILGAFIMQYASWRGSFWVLAVIGLAALIGSILYEETLVYQTTGSITKTMGRLWVVFKNPGFSSLLIIFSVFGIAQMCFISSSSYIYENGFGLSSQIYSYFFALNAMGLLAGALLLIPVSKVLNYEKIITFSFVVIVISGILVCVVGNFSPWIFALSLLPSTIASSLIRPPSTNLMLEQQKKDTGSASSLMTSFWFFMSSFGVIIMSLPWGISKMVTVGVMTVILGLLSGVAWLVVHKKPFIKPLPDYDEKAQEGSGTGGNSPAEMEARAEEAAGKSTDE